MPSPGGRCRDFREPGIRWPAVPLVGFDGDGPVRSDERKLAIKRLLRSEDNPQRRPLPGGDGGREHCELTRVFAAVLRLRGSC